MENHKFYGPSVPEKNWVPAPRYILRRNRIMCRMEKMPPGYLLEIGCGAGTLLYEFDKCGYTCEALETSPVALAIARYINSNSVRFYSTSQAEWKGKYDYVFAFEVLEHIEHHREALAVWRSWLKPEGMILISVPAHMSKWTATDDWAGHYRRYERWELEALVKKCGFKIKYLENYGFPLANLIDPFRSLMHSRNLKKRVRELNHGQNFANAYSGVDRNTEAMIYPILKSPPGILLMHLACKLQGRFSNKDLGNGYLILAKKCSSNI